MVRALDLRSAGREVDSLPPRCRTTLGQAFTHMCPPSASEVSTAWRYRNVINLMFLLQFLGGISRCAHDHHLVNLIMPPQ